MIQDQGDNFGWQVWEAMGSYLLGLGLEHTGEADLQAMRLGDWIHIRLYGPEGEEAFHVLGRDVGELGEQLALACLQRVTVERLSALHRQPLKPVLRSKKKLRSV